MNSIKRKKREKAKRKAANVAKLGPINSPGSKILKKTNNFPATLTMRNPGGVVSSAIRENAKEKYMEKKDAKQ